MWSTRVVADIRNCEQCGTSFAPRREHARFCSAGCRVEWNRKRTGDLKAGASALQWSITAMTATAERLPRVRAADLPRAFTVIGEAVWWVTIVDATLVRHHPDAYDRVMTAQTPTQRRRVEETLAGLRFVRNRIGDEADLAEFIESGTSSTATGEAPITSWTWKPMPEPALGLLAPRGRAWERARYQAYHDQLAGRTIGETFGRATQFLKLATANVPSITDPTMDAAR